MSIAQDTPPRTPLSFGTVRADDDTAAALAYEPIGQAASAAAEPWTDSERAEWADASERDAMRESGGGW